SVPPVDLWAARPVSATDRAIASAANLLEGTVGRRGQRQRKRERRALAQLTLHPDPTAVQLNELPTQGEAQPGALDLLVRRPHLPELLEHRLLILRGDADPGVADGDLDEPVL